MRKMLGLLFGFLSGRFREGFDGGAAFRFPRAVLGAVFSAESLSSPSDSSSSPSSDKLSFGEDEGVGLRKKEEEEENSQRHPPSR
jgi:hypothetical protein